MSVTRAIETWTVVPLERFVNEAGARLTMLMTPAGQVAQAVGKQFIMAKCSHKGLQLMQHCGSMAQTVAQHCWPYGHTDLLAPIVSGLMIGALPR